MSEQSIFNAAVTPDAVAPVVTPPFTPNLSPEVSEFVGAGKKYATLDDAIKSVPHAQKHISTLEAELAASKAELEKRRTAEDLLEELRAASNTQAPAQAGPSITTEEITQIVQRTLGQNEAQVKATNNIEKVKSAFLSSFGDTSAEVYDKVARESGLSMADLNKLAATSPNLVIKLAGITEKQNSPVNKPNSSINTEALNSTNNNQTLSARVKPGASTKDLVGAWKIAGQKVGKQS